MNRGFFVLTSILLSSAPSMAQAPARTSPNMGESYRVEIQLRRWRSDLIAELRLSGDGIPGTTLDPFGGLGLENERIYDYHFAARIVRRVKLRGSWMKVKYQGEKAAESALCVFGLFVPAGGGVYTPPRLAKN